MKTKLIIVLAGLMATSVTFSVETKHDVLVARRDFETSSAWSPKVFMGRDFWNIFPASRFNPNRETYGNSLYFPTEDLPEPMRKHLGIPAFTEVAIRAPVLTRSCLRTNSNGTVTLVPPDSYTEWVPTERPLILRPIRFTRPMGHSLDLWLHFNFEPYSEYQAWKERNPNVWCVNALSEWGNNMNTLFLRIPSYIAQGQITLPKLKELKEWYMENPPDRRAYVNHRLKPDFEKVRRTWQNDATVLNALDGMWNIGHLAAYWGAGSISVETSRSFNNWQYQMMSHRGAARQFNIPWCWYAANYIPFREPDGTTMGGQGADPWAWENERGGPDTGASLSSRERVYYMAYLSGANSYQSETATMCYWDATATGTDRWEPAPEGQIYIDFFNFTRENPDRGTPYTPIALLVAHDRGTSRLPGKAFWRYRYLHSDNMLDAFVTTIFPPFSPMEMHRRGIETTLQNSKYGDIFDIITPDFEKSEAFARILPAYKVAILIGDYEAHPDMVATLVDYVHAGGTLILNAKQLHLDFPAEFTGVKTAGEFIDKDYQFTVLKPEHATVLIADPENRPLFTRNVYGKGAVIVGAPNFLTPVYDDSSEKIANEALTATVSGKRKFPYVAWLLDNLLAEVLPAQVTGDIQYGFNRTPDGWWLYLFNNRGVLKTALTPQKIDPSAKTVVHVDLQGLQPSAIQDLVSGETFTGDTLDIPVEPGKYRILDIRLAEK